MCVASVSVCPGPRSPSVPHSLPPSEEGEWWELGDDSRGGIPYYYQTKTGETVWERPDGFIIPLTIIQVIAPPSSSLTSLTVLLFAANSPRSSSLSDGHTHA